MGLVTLNQALFDVMKECQTTKLGHEFIDERRAAHGSKEHSHDNCTMCAIAVVSTILLAELVTALERGDQLAARKILANYTLEGTLIGVVAGKRLVEVELLESKYD